MQDGERGTRPESEVRLGFTLATDAVLLPQPEPRAVGLHLIVPSISSRDVAHAQQSGIRSTSTSLNHLQSSLDQAPTPGANKVDQGIYGSFASSKCNLVSALLGIRVKPSEL
jgi:hypothetical protein